MTKPDILAGRPVRLSAGRGHTEVVRPPGSHHGGTNYKIMIIPALVTLVIAPGQAAAPAKPSTDPEIKLVKSFSGLRPIALAAAPSGSKFAASLENNTIRIIDAKTMTTLHTLSGHPQSAYGLAWSADGTFLASGDESARIWIWNAITGQKTREMRTHIRGIQKLSFNLPRTMLLSTGKDDVIKMYDLSNGKELKSILGSGANFYGATFHPKDNRIATGTLGTGGRVYNGLNVEGFLTGHASLGMSDCDWNPAGTRIASGGRDNTVAIWDVKGYKRIQTLRGHEEWVQTVKYSPNGKYLASSSTDRTVKIWDANAFRLIKTLENQSSLGSPICWTADGKFLLTVGIDDALQLNSVVPPQPKTDDVFRPNTGVPKKKKKGGRG